ncbi:MAG: hypothetical protein PHO92_00545 [Candidatus Peribacteraceae bacterium]|nr:hypothetical protein [Candidatus Peribacteraceae bacterium]
MTEIPEHSGEPTVLRELERLHAVGVRIPQHEGEEAFCDGKLRKRTPADTDHPYIHEGVYGFTSSVLPGARLRFHIERDQATDRADGNRPPPYWDTSPVETIELLSDGSYRITTESDGLHAVYILTGTHSHNREVIDDLDAVARGKQRTLRNLWGLLGRGGNT